MERILTKPQSAPHNRTAWLVAVFTYVALTTWAGIAVDRFDPAYLVMWLPNAGLLASLLVAPRKHRLELLACAFAAMFGTGLVIGAEHTRSLLQAMASIAEVCIALRLIEDNPAGRVDLTHLRGLVQFLIAGAGVAPMASAALVAGHDYLVDGASLHQAIVWFLSHALGLIVVTPAILTIYSAFRLAKGQARGEIVEVLILSAGLAVLCAIVFSQPLPLIYLLFPYVCLMSFRGRYVGAMLSALVIVSVATTLTMHGLGPLASNSNDPGTTLLLIQLLTVACVLTGLPMAVVLNERRGLMGSLEASERRFRESAQAAPIGIFTYDALWRITFANRAMEALFGGKAQPFVPERLRNLLPLPSPGEREDEGDAIEGSNLPLTIEIDDERPERKRWFDLRMAPLAGSLDEERQWIATITDVSERHRFAAEILHANERLTESNRLMRLAEDLAGVGYCRFDMREKQIEWSSLFRDMHGLAPDRPASLLSYARCIGAGQLRQLREQAEDAFDESRSFDVALRVRRQNGRIRMIDMHGQTEVDGSGRPVAIFGVCLDITDHLVIQEELRHSRDQALAVASARARFLAVMSHEIRTPMAGVLAIFELLAQAADAIQWPDTKLPLLIASTQAHAQTLMTVLDDVLDEARYASGSFALERVPFDPNVVVAEVVEMFRPKAAIRGILLSIGSVVPFITVGDPVRLRQIISNLVSNAIKFTERGSVEISCAVAGDEAFKIVVSDTGIGIPREALTRIFDPFAQVDGSTSRRFGGTGLGLSIVRNLVLAMEGSIKVDSTPDKGTRFVLSLPLRPAPSSPQFHASDPAPLPCGLKVLIVDDTEAIRLAACALLENMGCTVTCAGSGRQGVSALDASDFDVALVDCEMPELDGAATIRQMRDLPGSRGQMPILAFTAYTEAVRQDEMMQAGAQGIVAKPFTQSSLAAAISTVLNVRQAHAGRFGNERERLAPHEPPPSEDDFQTRMLSFAEPARREIASEVHSDLLWASHLLKTSIHDQVSITRAIHAIKGVSGTFGFNTLYDACVETEDATLRTGRNTQISNVLDLLEHAIQQIEELGFIPC